MGCDKDASGREEEGKSQSRILQLQVGLVGTPEMVGGSGNRDRCEVGASIAAQSPACAILIFSSMTRVLRATASFEVGRMVVSLRESNIRSLRSSHVIASHVPQIAGAMDAIVQVDRETRVAISAVVIQNHTERVRLDG